MIPYLTPSGVCGIQYRCIAEHNCKLISNHSKYLFPPAQRYRIYNADAYFSGRNYLGVAEGAFSAAAASIFLDIPTIGIPSATGWKGEAKYWSLVLRDFDRVIIFADGDEPGKTLAKQIAEESPMSTIVYCDDDEDIDSMVLAGKAELLRRKAGFKE